MKRKEWLKRLYKDDFVEEGLPFSLSEYVVERSWELHGHEFYEMELVLSGSGYQWINGFGMPMARGHLYLLTPVDAHKVNIQRDGELRLINFKFPEVFIDDEVLSGLLLRSEPLAVQLPPDSMADLEREFRRLQEEQTSDLQGKMQVIHYTLNRILIDLLRLIIASSPDHSSKDPRIREQHVKKQALSYIHTHYRELITLSQAASHVQLSPNYFSEKFHQWMGESFRNYVLQLRLTYADRLINSSTLPITDIAHNAGFNSLSYFIRAYKKHYGIPPNQTRKKVSLHENSENNTTFPNGG